MLGNPYLSRARVRAPRSAWSRAALAAGVVVAALLPAAPAAASPHADGSACTITAGEIRWGFKESFRAYISGSIANGEWTTTGNAGYDTPQFWWSGAVGEFDPATGSGHADFTGDIRFTGHNGLLDTTVSNPTLELPGDGSARLLVDVTGVSMEDAMSGAGAEPATVARVPLVSLDLAAAPLRIEGETAVATDVPAAITPEGFDAFGSYEAGTPFDPVSVSLNLDCSAPSPEPTPEPTMTIFDAPEPEELDAAPAGNGSEVPWLPWTLGGLALAAIAGVAAWVVTRRRRATRDATEPRDPGAPE